jgi:hypothetical protein
LLLDSNSCYSAKNVYLVGELLKLNKLDLPRAMLLSSNGLQRNGSVAMAASGIMKEHLNLFHRWHCACGDEASQEHSICHVENDKSLLCSMSSTMNFILLLLCLHRLFISRL